MFVEELSGVPVNNVAHSGQTQIAKYDPVLKKMFRRKSKKAFNKK
jgi:type IV secretory pathway TrbD component